MVLSQTERVWPSLSRCCSVPVLVVTLAIVSLASMSVKALDRLSPVNLLETLATDYKRYGIILTHGHTTESMAYRFESNSSISDRNLSLPSDIYQKAVETIRGYNDFTLIASIKQNNGTSGTIVSFSDDQTRNSYLELQSSGRKEEIRFHYSALDRYGQLESHTETFSYNLADNKWHKVALSVSGTEIQLLIDCNPLPSRVMRVMPDRNFSASTMKLFLGQSHQGLYPLKADLEEVRLVPGPYGYLTQCPLAAKSCPTCGEFFAMKNRMDACERNFVMLSSRSIEQDKQIKELTQMVNSLYNNRNSKRCSLAHKDGDVWEDEETCQNCTCKAGFISCQNITCPTLNCTNPEKVPGKCCPVCKQQCYMSKIKYEHKQVEIINCSICTCNDSVNDCVPLVCPKLTCKKQIPGKCCPVCEDIDECANKGDLNGNHCHQNTRCVNQIGNYTCECLPGFKRLDAFNCIDDNECESDVCAPFNAICLNTIGSYQCQCQTGYEMLANGTCMPVCNQTCTNGGVCLKPGVCKCPRGFAGESCEKDLDECETGQHTCKANEKCKNVLNGYFCDCRPGYAKSAHTGECEDIDECVKQTHTCIAPSQCVNTEGHFECRCPEDNPTCQRSCLYSKEVYADGERFHPPNEPCRVCTCSHGVMTCESRSCNCTAYRSRSASDRDVCCSHCDPKESCRHQELPHVEFRSGEKWIYRCLTCECLFGEVDCWQLNCMPLNCDDPLPLAPGECCRRCPNDPCAASGFDELYINSANNRTSAGGKPCTYRGRPYESGHVFHDLSRPCSTCSCKNGVVRCNFDSDCNVDDDAPPAKQHHVHGKGGHQTVEHAYSDRNHTAPKAPAATVLSVVDDDLPTLAGPADRTDNPMRRSSGTGIGVDSGSASVQPRADSDFVRVVADDSPYRSFSPVPTGDDSTGVLAGASSSRNPAEKATTSTPTTMASIWPLSNRRRSRG